MSGVHMEGLGSFHLDEGERDIERLKGGPHTASTVDALLHAGEPSRGAHLPNRALGLCGGPFCAVVATLAPAPSWECVVMVTCCHGDVLSW